MRRVVGRVLMVFVILVLLVVIGSGGALVYFIRQPFPQTDGALHLPGLSGEVTVIRDRFGVPHIYADTPQDLFRAQGFVHAQDRYFQMEFWRRVGQGRLAELFGKSALGQDKYIRTLGWNRVAAQEATLLPPETRDLLEAYASGVNAYALTNPDKLGFEFRVLGLIGRNWQPEPWKVENTLTWGKVMGWQLGENISDQILRAALLDKGGADLLNAVMPPYPSDAPVTVPSRGIGDSRFEITGTAALKPDLITQSPISNLGYLFSLLSATKDFEQATGLINTPEVGSNDWVIGGARTTTGKPIVANDPHLSVQMPSIWYQVGLHCRVVSPACPYDVVGVSFAGAPGVIIGHNNRIAWGVTNLKAAVEDLYVEHANPANPDQFDYMGKWEDAQIVEEKINVAGDPTPVSLRVRITRHGPIMSDVSSDLVVKDAVAGKDAIKDAIAVQWTGSQPGTLFNSVLKIDRAQNWDDFRNALREWDAPSQNFVYGDIDGNIGYQMPGRVPIRAKGTGVVPVPGWTGDSEWIGYVPFDALPTLYNPPEGFIATANNAVVDAQYPYYLGEDWDHGYRIRRIKQLISAKDKLSLDDVKAIQVDNASGFAVEMLPYLSTLNIPDDLTAHDALAELKMWDKRATRNSIGAAIFEVYYRQLAHNLFDGAIGPELAESALDVNDNTSIRTALRKLLAEPGSHWWSDAAKGVTNPRDHILIQTMRDTVDTLKARLGADVKNWQYGQLHTITFVNQTLGKSGIAPIESIFNRGPYPDDGAGASINAAAGDRTLAVVTAPSWRMIVDMNDFSQSQAIHATGQSGHAFNPHYDDMIRPWIEIQYNPFLYNKDEVLRNAEATLTLQP